MKSLNVLDNTNVCELWDNDYLYVTVWCCRGGRWRRASSRRSRWRSYPLRGRGRRVRGLVGFPRGHTAVEQPPRAGDRTHPQVRTLTLPSTSHLPFLPNIFIYWFVNLYTCHFACHYPAFRNFHFTTYPLSSSSSSSHYSSLLLITSSYPLAADFLLSTLPLVIPLCYRSCLRAYHTSGALSSPPAVHFPPLLLVLVSS